MIRHHWIAHPCPARRGHNGAWTCAQLPGVVVRHCGHPTALRPYHVDGAVDLGGRKFPRLAEAIEAVEQAAERAGLAQPEIPRSARPGRRRPADDRQACLEL